MAINSNGDLESVEPAHETPAMMIRLLAWYVALLIGIWIIQFILIALLKIELSSGGTVATVLAAMVPGEIYYRRTGQLPSNGFGWRMSIGFALSGLCVTALQAALSIGLGNAQTLQMVSNAQLVLAVLFVQIVTIGPMKWCFRWGASSRQRAVQRKQL